MGGDRQPARVRAPPARPRCRPRAARSGRSRAGPVAHADPSFLDSRTLLFVRSDGPAQGGLADGAGWDPGPVAGGCRVRGADRGSRVAAASSASGAHGATPSSSTHLDGGTGTADLRPSGQCAVPICSLEQFRKRDPGRDARRAAPHAEPGVAVVVARRGDHLASAAPRSGALLSVCGAGVAGLLGIPLRIGLAAHPREEREGAGVFTRRLLRLLRGLVVRGRTMILMWSASYAAVSP